MEAVRRKMQNLHDKKKESEAALKKALEDLEIKNKECDDEEELSEELAIECEALDEEVEKAKDMERDLLQKIREKEKHLDEQRQQYTILENHCRVCTEKVSKKEKEMDDYVCRNKEVCEKLKDQDLQEEEFEARVVDAQARLDIASENVKKVDEEVITTQNSIRSVSSHKEGADKKSKDVEEKYLACECELNELNAKSEELEKRCIELEKIQSEKESELDEKIKDHREKAEKRQQTYDEIMDVMDV